jgi:hypothetical protein
MIERENNADKKLRTQHSELYYTGLINSFVFI